MYKDHMIYKVGDLVKVGYPQDRLRTIGLVVSINENSTIYGVKFGKYVQNFHYSFIQPLSRKDCQGDIK